MKKVGAKASPRPLMSKQAWKNPSFNARIRRGPPPLRNTINGSHVPAVINQVHPLMSVRTIRNFSEHVTRNIVVRPLLDSFIPSLLEKRIDPPKIKKFHPNKKQRPSQLHTSHNLTTKPRKNFASKPQKTGTTKVLTSESDPLAATQNVKVGQKKPADCTSTYDQKDKSKTINQVKSNEKSVESAYAEHLKKLKRKGSPRQEKCLGKLGEDNSCPSPKKMKLESISTPKLCPDSLKIEETKKKSNLTRDAKQCSLQEVQSEPTTAMATDKLTQSKEQAILRSANKVGNLNKSNPWPNRAMKSNKNEVEPMRSSTLKGQSPANSNTVNQKKQGHQPGTLLNPVKQLNVSHYQRSLISDHPRIAENQNPQKKGKKDQLQQCDPAYFEHLKKLKNTSKPVPPVSSENAEKMDEKNRDTPNDRAAMGFSEEAVHIERDLETQNDRINESFGENTIRVKEKALKMVDDRIAVDSKGKMNEKPKVTSIQSHSDSFHKAAKMKEKNLTVFDAGSSEKMTALEETTHLQYSSRENASLKAEERECPIQSKTHAMPIPTVSSTDPKIRQLGTSRTSVISNSNLITCISSPFRTDITQRISSTGPFDSDFVNCPRYEANFSECSSAKDRSVKGSSNGSPAIKVSDDINFATTQSGFLDDGLNKKLTNPEKRQPSFLAKSQFIGAAHLSTSIGRWSNLSSSTKYKQPTTEDVMKFTEDDFSTIDSTFADEKDSSVKPNDKRKAVASDFFHDPDSKTTTTTVKGILTRTCHNRMKEQQQQMPTKETVDDTYHDNHPKIRPDLHMGSEVISVVPSIEREGEDVRAIRSIDSALASGLEYLQPVSGYHCILCQVFCRDYPTALHHCTQLSHKMKVVKDLSAK